MRDRKLYALIRLDEKGRQVEVLIEHGGCTSCSLHYTRGTVAKRRVWYCIMSRCRHRR